MAVHRKAQEKGDPFTVGGKRTFAAAAECRRLGIEDPVNLDSRTYNETGGHREQETMPSLKSLVGCPLKVCLPLSAAATICASAAWAQPAEGPSVVVFGGQMTDNHWEETFVPSEIDFLDSYLLGVGVGYEWPSRLPRTSIGLEAQMVAHFGRQDHVEFNLPLVVRYHPERPPVPALESLAFGIGLSTATKDPQTEVDRDGKTTKTLVYWMGELAFRLPREDTALIFRLHHRSDAYGVFPNDSGSNAVTIGIRWRF